MKWFRLFLGDVTVTPTQNFNFYYSGRVGIKYKLLQKGIGIYINSDTICDSYISISTWSRVTSRTVRRKCLLIPPWHIPLEIQFCAVRIGQRSENAKILVCLLRPNCWNAHFSEFQANSTGPEFVEEHYFRIYLIAIVPSYTNIEVKLYTLVLRRSYRSCTLFKSRRNLIKLHIMSWHSHKVVAVFVLTWK